MPDKAQTDLDTSFSTLLAAHARGGKLVDRPVDRVVSLQRRGAETIAPAEPERSGVANQSGADWSSAIELIQEATEAIRISEDRAAELEEQLAQFNVEANDQIRRLQADVGGRDQKIAQIEERLRLAEARAENAETWLRKLYDAVHSSFSSLRRP